MANDLFKKLNVKYNVRGWEIIILVIPLTFFLCGWRVSFAFCRRDLILHRLYSYPGGYLCSYQGVTTWCDCGVGWPNSFEKPLSTHLFLKSLSTH